MLRPVLILSAFTAMPAAAATYSAKLTAPTTQGFIARDISWSCTAAGCTGATEESRPAVLCQSLARRVGKIEDFAVDGRAFSAAELVRCNASAKAATGKAVAAQ